MNKNSTTKAMTPAAGTPEGKPTSSSRKRSPVPPKQTIGRELIDWLGTLTLSGGDLDGQPFQVWPWEKKFIMGTFGQPGNAALSIARGNGKSGFCGALAAAVVCSRCAACMEPSGK